MHAGGLKWIAKWKPLINWGIRAVRRRWATRVQDWTVARNCWRILVWYKFHVTPVKFDGRTVALCQEGQRSHVLNWHLTRAGHSLCLGFAWDIGKQSILWKSRKTWNITATSIFFNTSSFRQQGTIWLSRSKIRLPPLTDSELCHYVHQNWNGIKTKYLRSLYACLPHQDATLRCAQS